ncbi:lupus la ribonucleoprotein [Striga asiatica]|uniref:Lupus la ribonucleoprotein n=1 Tax=Striga asiatica TaxID=4170 RepID=A0A5A7Q0Z9_STRAF|nr:lupus la ribonucleoprotein [Striga asiatica]
MNDVSRPTADAAASNGGGVSSPQSQRRSLTSAWASVVRGDSEQNSSPTAAGDPGSSSSPPLAEQSPENPVVESSGSEAQPETPDANGDINAGQQRRPAWNRPVNGVVEPVSVMGGAVSWPALSETTRPIPRSSSDSPRPISDGLSSSTQATITSPPPQQPVNNNAHGNSSANHPQTRQRSRNRNGGGGGGNSSVSSQPQPAFNQPSLPMPPPFPVFEVPYGMVPAVMDASVRGPRAVGGSQSHAGNSYSNQRNNNSRRGNYGSRPRGDGHYHNNHGGRRDHDRREVHHPPQYVPPPMGYMPSPLPPGAAPFLAPPPVRVFAGQMGFDMASPFIYVPTMAQESFRAMPLVPSPPPMLFSPTNETSLANMIVKQIDFYFSDDNLVKDNYLRSNMDDQGWVPIALIASFRRLWVPNFEVGLVITDSYMLSMNIGLKLLSCCVNELWGSLVQQMTKDVPVILDSLRYSTVVEVQGEKVRRRNEWSKWVNTSGRRNLDSGTNASSSAPESALVSSLQATTLDDAPTNADGSTDAARGGQLNEFTGQTSLANGEKDGGESRSDAV